MTPQRFGRPIQQVKNLKRNAEERLKGATELLLDRLSEPGCCCWDEDGLSDASLEVFKLLLNNINDDGAFTQSAPGGGGGRHGDRGSPSSGSSLS